MKELQCSGDIALLSLLFGAKQGGQPRGNDSETSQSLILPTKNKRFLYICPSSFYLGSHHADHTSFPELPYILTRRTWYSDQGVVFICYMIPTHISYIIG